ncbi:MAG: hypothetical protein GY790_21685 [Bacteroidetes bacterium]|nr:hypothetical protein [Bacteroidota bacterium]
MTIGNSIKQLLEERKRVILPGFGNLEVKESGGSVTTSGKRIDPPGLTIRFDSSYSKDDGVLAAAFTKAGGVDKEEAEQQVLELVDAIRFALDKGENYPLDDTGIFRRDEEGKTFFQADPSLMLEPDQYGLGSMDLLELEDLPLEEDKATQAVPESEPVPKAAEEPVPEPVEKTEPAEKPIPGPAPRPIAKTVSQPYEPWKQEKAKSRSGLWRVIWIVTGVLVVVLVALIFVPAGKLGIFGKKELHEQAIQAEEPAATPEIPDQHQAEEVETDETPQSEPEQPVVKEAEPEPVPAQPENHFFIIAGSFKHLGNASELQDKLKDSGYPAEVMITENRMYRVSVDSYSTRQEAESSMARMKSEPGLESCWLLSNE